MSLDVDLRSAIFAQGKPTYPAGFDPNLVDQTLKDAQSLLTLSWSVNPDLGMPVAPFEIFVNDDVELEQLETRLDPITLDVGSGFVELLDPRKFLPERILYIRGVVSYLGGGSHVFSVDIRGKPIRETYQRVAISDPFILFGPGIAGFGADGGLKLEKLYVALAPVNKPGAKATDVAPPFNIPIYQQEAFGKAAIDGVTAAFLRLQNTTFARAIGPAPSDPDLLREIHLENVGQSAADVLRYPPIVKLGQNIDQALTNPDWNYVVQDTTSGTATEMTVYAVRMLPVLSALGPIESATLGFSTTVPSGKVPCLARREVWARLNAGKVPFSIVTLLGYFAGVGFKDTGSVQGNRTAARRLTRTFARLSFLDQEVSPSVSAGTVVEPPESDQPATVDIDLTLAFAGWAETSFLARTTGNDGDSSLVRDDAGRPKLFTARPYLKDISPASDPWFADTAVEVPEKSGSRVAYQIFRRDEFGRWALKLETDSQLPSYLVQPPSIDEMAVLYAPNGDLSVRLVVSRSWKRRSLRDIGIGLTWAKTADDPILSSLTPGAGVTTPAAGKGSGFQIGFNSDGSPSVIFKGMGPPPTVVPDQAEPLPWDRSYTLTLALGSPEDLFGVAQTELWVAASADASNKLTGVGTRSTPAGPRLTKGFDPRPPRLDSVPWQLVWSSRPNPQRRVRVLLEAPTASGQPVSQFRIWQATETALIAFAIETAKNDPEAIAAIEQLQVLLRRTTNMRLRAQLLRNQIEPLLTNDERRIAFFSRFDAVSDQVWPGTSAAELELSAHSDGLLVLLLTGISSVGAETADIQEADLRVVAVPDRIEDGPPVLQIVAPLDNPAVTPNACLLIAEVAQPTNATDLRVFWDLDGEVSGEEDLLYQLGEANCFPLTVNEARQYLADVDDLVRRLRSPHFLLFLLLLPESWTAHHFSADILSAQSSSPADEIPSRRAAMVSTFISPGLGPTLTLKRRDVTNLHVQWEVTSTGLSIIAPPGYPSADLYMATADGSAATGALAWSNVLANGANLQNGASRISLSAIGVTLTVTASPYPAPVKTTLGVRDPLGRSASVVLE